jgi:hypothetical protein
MAIETKVVIQRIGKCYHRGLLVMGLLPPPLVKEGTSSAMDAEQTRSPVEQAGNPAGQLESKSLSLSKRFKKKGRIHWCGDPGGEPGTARLPKSKQGDSWDGWP